MWTYTRARVRFVFLRLTEGMQHRVSGDARSIGTLAIHQSLFRHFRSQQITSNLWRENRHVRNGAKVGTLIRRRSAAKSLQWRHSGVNLHRPSNDSVLERRKDPCAGSELNVVVVAHRQVDAVHVRADRAVSDPVTSTRNERDR